MGSFEEPLLLKDQDKALVLEATVGGKLVSAMVTAQKNEAFKKPRVQKRLESH